MDVVDRYAYSNRLRYVDPGHKAALALATLALCLALNDAAVGLLAVAWMIVLAAPVAGAPLRTLVRLLLTEGAFMVLTTVGVALSISTRDPAGLAAWAWRLGPIWFSSSPESLQAAGTLVARALGCTAAMNFLALTTPLVDLIELARRWRLPPVLVDIMTIVYRYIFVLLGSLERMRTAQDSRLGYASFWRGMTSAGLLASRLFIESYHRSRQLHTALESRGYLDDFRVLPLTYRSDWRLAAAGLGIVVSLASAKWWL